MSHASDSLPALAEAIVLHARSVCETADQLWRVLSRVSIPADGLTDHRQQHKTTFGTEPMARVYLYQQIFGLTQGEVATHLDTQPSLLKELGMSQPPTQQNLSYAWNQFSDQTKTVLEVAATGIAQEAVDRGVIMEARVPIVPDEDDFSDDGDEATASREYVREQGSKLVKLARRHAFNEFDSPRADNKIYEDKEILDLFSTACLTQGSAHSSATCCATRWRQSWSSG